MRATAHIRMRRRQPLPVQLFDVCLVQLSNWRWSWRGMIVLGMAAPLLSVATLSRFTSTRSHDVLAAILVGSVALALMFESQNKVSSNFAYMRATGALRYFATLPIHKHVLILATAIAFFILSLPAVFVTVVAGSAILHVHLHPSPLLLVVIPLTAVPLAGVGALIGTTARTPEEAGSLSLFAALVLLTLGPVLLPSQRLPEAVRIIGHASPATYAASALRQTLLGPVTGHLAVDLAALAGFTFVLFGLVGRLLDWRQA
jgi:ABC-2 type transport system permease protein